MTNYMVKSGTGTGSGRICFPNPAKSGSGQCSQKQIQYSPRHSTVAVNTNKSVSEFSFTLVSFLQQLNQQLSQ